MPTKTMFFSLLLLLAAGQCIAQIEWAFLVEHGNNSPANFGKDALAITNTKNNITWALHVSGTREQSLQFFYKDALELKVLPDGTLHTISDLNRKFNVSLMLNGQLANILQLQPRQYYWKGVEASQPSYGFIAQEVSRVFPMLTNVEVDSKGKETWTMNYTGLIPFLVKAIQEQQGLIEQKNKSIDQLEERLAKLEERLARLEAGTE